VLLGHSYGGDVALALAQRHPETVAAAVVYEPPMPWLEIWRSTEAPRDEVPWMADDPQEAAERFIRHVVGDARFERIPAATRSELVKDGPALVAELATIRRQPPPFDPQLVEVPVSVVWGAESLERHRRGADWLVNSLPRATRHVLEGATHNGHRTHSKELAEIVLAAVGSAFGQPAGAGSRRSP